MSAKSLFTKAAVAGTTLLLAGGVAATAASSASAATVRPAPHHVAAGSVAVKGAGYLQYEQFTVLQGYGPNHGTVDYTNWQYATQGTGVYAPKAGPIGLTFYQGTAPYAHTLDGATLKLKALSPERLRFEGTGSYNANAAAYPWTVKGEVNRARLHAVIVYGGTGNPGYTLTLDGRIAADGSVSGAAVNATQQLTFKMDAGSFPSVLHYTARVQSERIQGRNAVFTFVIPRWVSGLAGTPVTDRVHDGGPVWRDGFAQVGVGPEQIVGGPGVTIR